MNQDRELKKIEHLNLVLRAIREIDRLIITAGNSTELIHGACSILVKKRGYFNVWIGLLNNDGTLIDVAQSGLNDEFTPVKAQLAEGNYTTCITEALKTDNVFIVADPYTECTDCLLSVNYSGRTAMAVRLSYKDKIYGFMVLSIPRDFACDTEEKNIVREIADDISFGLFRIELEEQRKQAELALIKSEQSFRTLIENSLNCITILQDNRIVYRNIGLRQSHRYLAEVFQPPAFDLVHHNDRNKVKGKYQQLMSGEKRHITVDFRYYLQDEHQVKHGTRWGLCSATTIDYLGDRAILTNITDITDSKEIENFLRIQDKMASLGRVTAGIAHEIRNPLSGVYIYLKTLRRIYNNYGDINKVISLIDKIENASAKIESIIKRVMDFSKPGTPNFVETDLNPCIDDVTKLTAVTLRKKGVKFIKNLDPDLPKCWTDPHLIEQVILNLITNAAEAVKEAKGEHIIEVSSSKNKGHIVIKVSDSGPGIPHSHQNKIFDPFYTTKTNNSGIGLSICHRIITDHGGSLKYNPGKLGGADFIIEIPLDRQNGNADL